MIKICGVALDEAQGQYNLHVVHDYVSGSDHATFDDDDFSSFRGVDCEGHTHRHTDYFGLVYLRLFQSSHRLRKQKETFVLHARTGATVTKTFQ